MASQPARPGRLRREVTDVLPMPYHEMSHWREASWGVSVGWAMEENEEGGTYHREPLPVGQDELVVLAVWREPVGDEADCGGGHGGGHGAVVVDITGLCCQGRLL